MADTVTVTVVKWHTRGGIVQPLHATYEVAPDEVDNLVAQGFVTAGAPAAPPADAPTADDANSAAPPRAYRTAEAAVPQKAVLTPTPKSTKTAKTPTPKSKKKSKK